jgi:hypothetical protein
MEYLHKHGGGLQSGDGGIKDNVIKYLERVPRECVGSTAGGMSRFFESVF